MKLLNTIEIEPWDYTENEYESPSVSKVENPKAWSDFWYKCISDSNLQNLQPIELGSYLVDINKIGESELKTIIKKELKNVDLSDFQEYVGQIIGGIVVLENEKIEDELNYTQKIHIMKEALKKDILNMKDDNEEKINVLDEDNFIKIIKK